MHSTGLLLYAFLLLVAAICSDGGGMQDMVSAALQYVSIGDAPPIGPSPASAPAIADFLPRGTITDLAAGNISDTSSLLQAEALQERSRGVTLPPCSDFFQQQRLTGTWVDHWDPDYMGVYEMTADCPDWAQDYDCRRPPPKTSALVAPDLIKSQYRQIFQPDACQLRMTNAADLAVRMASRRLIMLGDSLMRLHFFSLACLLRAHIAAGRASVWDRSDIKWKGNYTANLDGSNIQVVKQFVGEFRLTTGAEVYLRDFGVYNQTLFDNLLSDFAPLRSTDVLLLNWGAWYPRFAWGSGEANWRMWQDHMRQLFTERLAALPLQVIWKQHAAIHFGGATGAETGFENSLPGGPWRYTCYWAVKGEYWYDDFVRGLLSGPCKAGCTQVKVLPIFDMTLTRPNSHHGSMGRGVSDGNADCRHWCNNVVDHWSHLLYNMLSPPT